MVPPQSLTKFPQWGGTVCSDYSSFNDLHQNIYFYHWSALQLSQSLPEWHDRVYCVDGHHLGLLPVTSEVPQGSILGPLFLIMYINNLPSFLSSSQALLYADDTKYFQPILSSSDSPSLFFKLTLINTGIGAHWICYHLMYPSVISFVFEKVDTSYHLSGLPLTSVNHCKDLWIIFSDHLSWNDSWRAKLREWNRGRSEWIDIVKNNPRQNLDETADKEIGW